MLGDKNRNLIHHLSASHYNMLSDILKMPGFHSFYLRYQDKDPIFFNFYGDTPMTLALKF